MELVYNRSQGFYQLKQPFKVVDVKEATTDDIQHHMNGNYQKIFDQYDSERDIVQFNDLYSGKVYLILKREFQEEEYFGIDEDEVSQKIEPGLYRFDEVNYEIVIRPFNNVEFDDYIDLGLANRNFEDDIKNFFDKKEVFENTGTKYSRGSLVYGPQGTGKTMTVMKSVHNLIEEEGIAGFVLSGEVIEHFSMLQPFKEALEGQEVIFILEEITDRQEDLSTILDFLDGEFSWSNAYTIATTNYPQRMPENLVDRPGRFDQVYEFGNPRPKDRRKFLNHYLDDVSDEIVEKSEGFSLAHLKEVIVRSKLHEQSMIKSINELNNLKDKVDSDFSGTDTLSEDKAETYNS